MRSRWDFRYVPASERRERILRERRRFAPEDGVLVAARGKIATTFWGRPMRR